MRSSEHSQCTIGCTCAGPLSRGQSWKAAVRLVNVPWSTAPNPCAVVKWVGSVTSHKLKLSVACSPVFVALWMRCIRPCHFILINIRWMLFAKIWVHYFGRGSCQIWIFAGPAESAIYFQFYYSHLLQHLHSNCMRVELCALAQQCV